MKCTTIAATFLALLAVTIASAQEISPLERMMELNRMGEWEQAAQLADQFLQNGATKPQAERCHAYTNLALNEPGTSWAYSNEGAQLLSPLLDKAAGEPIQDYARKRLFKPLGMQRTRLHLDEKKHAWT
ncbi:MAG: serine hydrolase domain-containing protein [Pyrinomonadaceae bacterium]